MDRKVQKREKYKLSEPVLFPPLKQTLTQLDVDEDRYKEIGRFTINLLKLSENSIYKLLYNRENTSEFISITNSKSLRSDYLKKLVEVNDEYFPRELMLDKFKRVPDLSFEEKLKSKIKSSEKKTDRKGKKENKGRDLLGRKESSALERRESVDLENLEKQKKSKTDDQLNIMEENESEVEEENEEQSYEDEDFLMGSEDAGDAGDEDEANYSDGGVF